MEDEGFSRRVSYSYRLFVLRDDLRGTEFLFNRIDIGMKRFE